MPVTLRGLLQMMDTRTPEQRRKIMKSVGTKDTGPEMTVRRMVHRMGYRFRLHRKDLPGTPDLVFPGKRKVLFVHGCYWHGHGCAKGRLPKSRLEYWEPKIKKNRLRDTKAIAALASLGWKALVVWQCETSDFSALRSRLARFLGATSKNRRLSRKRLI